MLRLYIDVETIPAQRQDVRDRFHEAALEDARTAPLPSDIAKLKTPELREERAAAWHAERIQAAPDVADEQWHRTSLNGGRGELAVVAWAWGDGEVLHVDRQSAGSEVGLLAILWDLLDEYRRHVGSPGVVWCGYNLSFDMRFVWHRSIIRGVQPKIYIPVQDPPWKGTYIDAMIEFWGTRQKDKRDPVRRDMKTLCEILDIDVSADDIDGSQVWDAWQAGRVDDVVEHCRRDVERVRQVLKRLKWEA